MVELCGMLRWTMTISSETIKTVRKKTLSIHRAGGSLAIRDSVLGLGLSAHWSESTGVDDMAILRNFPAVPQNPPTPLYAAPGTKYRLYINICCVAYKSYVDWRFDL